MVSKKLLGLAIAAAFSSQAFAAVDFDNANPAKSKVAKQALVKTGKETISGADYYLVSQGLKFDTAITVKAGIGITAAQKRYVRVSLNGGYFGATAGALTGTTLNAISAADTKIVQGGNAKDKYVVYEVTGGSAGALQDEVLNIAAAALLVPAAGSIDITYAIYSTIDGAAGDTPAGTPLKTKTVSAIVSITDGLTTTYTPGSTTADVDNGFKQIVGKAVNVRSEIGKLTLAAADAAKNTGAAVAVADIVDTAATKTVIKGDFSVGDFSLSADNCTTATTPLTPNTAKTQVEVTAAQLLAAPSLCISVPDFTKVIPAGDFSAVTTVGLGALDVAFTAAVPNGTVGSIARNGTTIQVPFLSTFADYKQRLVLVNRGSSDVPYTITFTSEEGTTATAGTAATGTLKAGKTAVLNSTDVVSITGATTRTAATVVISSPTGKIDAATTMVNVSDKSTDTVKLN